MTPSAVYGVAVNPTRSLPLLGLVEVVQRSPRVIPGLSYLLFKKVTCLFRLVCWIVYPLGVLFAHGCS